GPAGPPGPQEPGPPGPPDAAETAAQRGPFLETGTRTPGLENGRIIYATTCVTCRGETGQGGTHGAPALTDELTLGAIVSTVTNGRNDMPAYGAVMSPEDVQDIATYVLEELIRE